MLANHGFGGQPGGGSLYFLSTIRKNKASGSGSARGSPTCSRVPMGERQREGEATKGRPRATGRANLRD
jgi:hypothetical protein